MLLTCRKNVFRRTIKQKSNQEGEVPSPPQAWLCLWCLSLKPLSSAVCVSVEWLGRLWDLAVSCASWSGAPSERSVSLSPCHSLRMGRPDGKVELLGAHDLGPRSPEVGSGGPWPVVTLEGDSRSVLQTSLSLFVIYCRHGNLAGLSKMAPGIPPAAPPGRCWAWIGWRVLSLPRPSPPPAPRRCVPTHTPPQGQCLVTSESRLSPSLSFLCFPE